MCSASITWNFSVCICDMYMATNLSGVISIYDDVELIYINHSDSLSLFL